VKRRLAVLFSICACAMLCLACSGNAGSGRPARVSNIPLGSQNASGAVQQTAPACPAATAGPSGWAEEVSDAGRVVWERPLTTSPPDFSELPPVASGGVVAFADAGSVYGLRMSDGRELWTAAIGQSVTALWAGPSGSLLVTGGVSGATTLSSWDAATGRKRWQVKAPVDASSAGPQLTSDGGIAAESTAGALEVFSAATGQLRWSDPDATAGYPGPQVLGSVIVGAGRGQVRAYSTLTGAPAWTVRGMTAQPEVTEQGGIIFVMSEPLGAKTPAGVTALSPSTGRVLWHLGLHALVGFDSAGPAGLEMDSANPGMVYLVDPVTGRVRWQAAASLQGGPIALITGTDVVYAVTSPAGQLIDRDAATGAVRWAGKPFTGQVSPLTPLGSGLAVAATWGSTGSLTAFSIATGKTAWQVKLPGAAAAPPPAPLVTGADMFVLTAGPFSTCG
jgi:outer membrane protein assembly factor BamB